MNQRVSRHVPQSGRVDDEATLLLLSISWPDCRSFAKALLSPELIVASVGLVTTIDTGVAVPSCRDLQRAITYSSILEGLFFRISFLIT